MKIQTRMARDTPENEVIREGIETQKDAERVRNAHHIKSAAKGDIRTISGDSDLVINRPDVYHEERLRQSEVIYRCNDHFKSRKQKADRKKYITWNNWTRAGGVIRTAVRGVMAETAKESRHSLLKTKIDKNSTSDTGTEAIKQGLTEIRYMDNARKSVNKTIQVGIKTAQSVKETPKTLKLNVQKIREKLIRTHRTKKAMIANKKSKAASAVAKKTASVVGKVMTSKGFIAVAFGGGLVLLMTTLISGFFSIIISSVSSMFSWATPEDDTDQRDYLQQYRVRVQNIESEIQADINSELSYTPEYRYDGSEITSLKQWGNTAISVDENAVIAAAAVKKFQEGNGILTDDMIAEVIGYFYTLEYSTETGYCPDCDCMKDEAKEQTVIDGDFYVSDIVYVANTNEYAVSFRGTTYEHTSSVWTDLTIKMNDGGSITGSAYADVSGSDWNVTFNISADGYSKIDWEDITIKTTTVYCNNPDHTIYKCEVTILDMETVLAAMGFPNDQQSIFLTYYGIMQNGGF